MLNYWWVTRPKRRLNSIPEVLACCSKVSIDQEWQGRRDTHLLLEKELEDAGLKRVGERRDQTGGGGRTYLAWILSLGLVFLQDSTGCLKLTLAGEAIMSGDSPVTILKNQILKYQFPSSFSVGRSVNVAPRFKIRPFRFLLRLLGDPSIVYLSEEEIAKIVVIEAEDETEQCCRKVTERIHEFRIKGDSCLEANFFEKYKSSKGKINPNHPFRHLTDVANTMINWLEYSQLAKRDETDKLLRIVPDRIEEIENILSESPPFIDRPEHHEYFQRKYGLDPKHRKDTRNLSATRTITARLINEQKIKQAFIAESIKAPIVKITADLIDRIAEYAGIDIGLVEETLLKLYPRGAIGSFMSEYFEMAFKGRDEATEFEKATVELFNTIFGYDARHVGHMGLTPDVLVLSDTSGHCGIIDNKAYSRYSISNDHRNRMIHNYIRNVKNYYKGELPLSFFSYIAGGFSTSINGQIQSIAEETSICGSAVSVSSIISLAENHAAVPLSHSRLQEIFSLNRQVILSDLRPPL